MSVALSQPLHLVADRFPDWAALDDVGRAAAEEQCRRRLETIGVALNAVARVIPQQKPSPGALAGLPYAVKDMIANGYAAPSWGCASPLERRTAPAAVVDTLNACGASMVATAEMTTLAYEPSGFNKERGNVLNPWNSASVPGGSSSGSAALVAAGCCDVALGSDTGGSVRIPAHCCGITALKPSWGAISEEGVMPLAPSLDTIGILARSVIDIAVVWRALVGRRPDLRGVTKATVIEGALTECDPNIVALFRDAVATIARVGVRIGSSRGFPQGADRAALLVMQAEAARTHRDLIASETLDSVLRKRLSKGFDIPDGDLDATLRRRDATCEEFLAQCLGDADVAILPVMPVTTPRYEETDASSPAFNPRKLYAMSRFTRFVNYLGLPALALPMGFDSHSLPAALQIVGRPGSEAQLLDMGRRFQEETDWHGRVPKGIAADTLTTRQG